MGRYYQGDIHGKFWFGVQPSDDAEQFGAIAGEQNFIPYCASELGLAKKRIYELFEELGIPPVLYDMNTDKGEEDFYAAHGAYMTDKGENDGDNGRWASLDLGLRIFHCIREQGDCCFEAEL